MSQCLVSSPSTLNNHRRAASPAILTLQRIQRWHRRSITPLHPAAARSSSSICVRADAISRASSLPASLSSATPVLTYTSYEGNSWSLELAKSGALTRAMQVYAAPPLPKGQFRSQTTRPSPRRTASRRPMAGGGPYLWGRGLHVSRHQTGNQGHRRRNTGCSHRPSCFDYGA